MDRVSFPIPDIHYHRDFHSGFSEKEDFKSVAWASKEGRQKERFVLLMEEKEEEKGEEGEEEG